MLQPGVKDEFLNVFYQNFIKLLVDRLHRSKDTPSNNQNGKEGDSAKEESKEEKKEEGDKDKTEKPSEEKAEKEGEKKEEEKKETTTVKKQEKKEASDREHRYGRADLSAGFVQTNVCELLSYCIRHHGYRIKYFLLGGNAVQKVLKLLKHKDSFLVLGIII